MKNLDRIYGLTKSQILLDELSCQINLDYFVRSQSNQLLCMYKEKKTSWDESDSDYIVRAAIFVASKLKYAGNDNVTVINLSNILKDLPNFHEFMVKFKDFLVNINVDLRVKSDMQSIISSYAFSLTLYNKYEEIWNTFQFPNEEVKSLKKIGWSIFLLSRVNLIQRRSEIVECACMLLAVIYIIINSCPLECFKIFQKDEQEFLKSLSFMIRGQADQIRISATHLKKMLELFIHHRVIESDSGIQGIFKPENIKQNYDKLNLEYFHKLLPSEFDQRLFVENPKNFDFSHSRNFMLKKILRYEFPVVLQNSELYEIGVKEKNFNEQNLET